MIIISGVPSFKIFTVGLFQCLTHYILVDYMFDKSICHFRDVRSILLLLFHF